MSRLFLFAVLLLGGCSIPIPRGPIADFFTKDYELPNYDARTADLARSFLDFDSSPASAAFGGLAGAGAGGAKTWHPSSAVGLGGPSGAALSHLMNEARTVAPLPETYNLFALALPIIATDPNKGPTVGLIAPAVFKERKRITNILAPDVTVNEIDGIGAIFRMRRAFSRVSDLLIDAGTSSEGNDEYEIRFRQRRFGINQALFYETRFVYRTELSTRFYGIGNDTDEDDESSYVFRQTVAQALIGVEIPFDMRIELRERVVSYKVGPGRLDRVPSTRLRYPNVEGVRGDRFTIQAHQIRLTYDTRDSLTTPTRGLFGDFTYELSDGTLGSEVGFQRFGLTLSGLFPKLKGRMTTVVRMSGWILTGDKIPFYELTQLGGRNTIRGYGQGRFVDQNGYVVNLEERINILDYTIAGVDQVLQLAGFIDAGRVFAEGERFTLKQTKIAVGAAIRLVIPDSELVTSIDIGVSNEGPAVFVALDYPF
ncbi:MAG: BamA/TamA family outer membrane protein [Planctomycetes bacterium]|nr:BamA/TamA family outer membrane protein [Planctomycetota bacterium]